MYASGFVVRKLLRKYGKIDTTLAAEVTETLLNLLEGGKFEKEDSSFEDFLRDWFQDVDRGGLSLVSPTAFSFFKFIEIVVFKFLQPIMRGKQPACKAHITTAVCHDEHLQFLWSTIAIDITKESDSNLLLQEIVDCWVTIRGHSMTSMVVEMYKKRKAVNTKGSKGIRKQLKLGEYSVIYTNNIQCVRRLHAVSVSTLPPSSQWQLFYYVVTVLHLCICFLSFK